MAMTLGELRADVLGWLDESTASEDSATWTNVTNALLQAHTMRVTEDPWPFMLWPKFETFSLVSGTTIYSLHQEFLRPFTFRNLTKKQTMIEVPARVLSGTDYDFVNSLDTTGFALWTRSDVKAQPTSASVMTIVSTSASDNTAAKAITIYGDTASGMASETITPNGTTPVAGTTSFTQIISVTKGAAWAGTLTITSNSGAVTVLTLGATEYGRSYPQIQLLGTPTSADTIQYRFYRKPRPLANANDITDIPAPFERILVFDALLLMGAYDNRLDGGRASLWGRMRDDLDMQMRQAFIEGQSVGALPRLISSPFSSLISQQSPA